MSITLRRPSGPPDSPEQPGPKPKRRARPTPPPAGEDLRIGSDPRVDLLPPEVRSARRDARTRRGFVWGVLAVVLAVIIGIGAAFGFNVLAQTQLFAAQQRADQLLAGQQKYLPVRTIQNQVDVAEAAQQVGASTEIAWQPFIAAIGAVEPAGLKMNHITVDSASPIANFEQSTDPLQGPRVATLTIVTVSATLPDVPAWVSAVLKVDGVVDAVPGAVNLDETGIYTSSVTIHVDESLFTKRFQPKEK